MEQTLLASFFQHCPRESTGALDINMNKHLLHVFSKRLDHSFLAPHFKWKLVSHYSDPQGRFHLSVFQLLANISEEENVTSLLESEILQNSEPLYRFYGDCNFRLEFCVQRTAVEFSSHFLRLLVGLNIGLVLRSEGEADMDAGST
jgi:hypothetical protein